MKPLFDTDTFREILDSINSQATGDIMPEEQNTEQSEPVQGTIKFF